MCSAGCPLHLLLLHHALADHLVHRGFNGGRTDHLVVPITFAEVRDELLIVADVGLEYAYTLGHLLRSGEGTSGNSRSIRRPSNRCSAWNVLPCQRKCLMLSNSRATSSPTFGCSSFKVFTCCSTVIRVAM